MSCNSALQCFLLIILHFFMSSLPPFMKSFAADAEEMCNKEKKWNLENFSFKREHIRTCPIWFMRLNLMLAVYMGYLIVKEKPLVFFFLNCNALWAVVWAGGWNGPSIWTFRLCLKRVLHLHNKKTHFTVESSSKLSVCDKIGSWALSCLHLYCNNFTFWRVWANKQMHNHV